MYRFFFKRILDIFISLVLIIFLLPVLVLVSLLIIYEMGYPSLFTHLRSGKGKKPFKIFKFRTMRHPSPGASDENRITPLGIFLRKWSLDELPQFYNVVKGDMSLIGPRPLLLEYDKHYSDEQNKRFLVKPGVTGLAQITGRNELTWDEKFSLDVKYVDTLCFSNDLKILFETIYVVLGAKGFRKSGEEKKFSENNME